MTTYSSDLRAASRPLRRDRARREKYFNFRHIYPGSLGQPHRNLRIPSSPFAVSLPADAPIEMWSKRQMYDEAQHWPRPGRFHHASPDKWRDKWGKTAQWYNRKVRRKEVRKSLEGVEKGDRWREEVIGERRRWTDCGCVLCKMENEWEVEREAMYERQAEKQEEYVRQLIGSDLEMELVVDQALVQLEDAEWQVVEIDEESDDDDFVLVED